MSDQEVLVDQEGAIKKALQLHLRLALPAARLDPIAHSVDK